MAECYDFEAVQQEIRKAFEQYSKGGVCLWIYWILRFLDVSLATSMGMLRHRSICRILAAGLTSFHLGFRCFE